MKWDSARKVLQISDYKGETAKPKPFIKGMLETINQSYFYIESLIVKNFSRSRQRPQSTSGTLQEYWYDVSFQLNPGKVEIAVFIHNLRKYDAHHITLESRIVSQTTLGEDWRHSEKFASQTTLGEETNVFSANFLFKDCCQLTSKASSILLSESWLQQAHNSQRKRHQKLWSPKAVRVRQKKLKLPLRKRLCPYRKWTVWNRLWANQVAANREKRKSATPITSHNGLLLRYKSI